MLVDRRVRFLVHAFRRAMVGAVTPTPFDRFGKEMVRDAVEGRCTVESDAEVSASTRRVDLWITPRAECTPTPDPFGLLGRITSTPVTLEFFDNPPSGEELHLCLLKYREFRRFMSRKKTLPPIPTQWVISTGRHSRWATGHL